MAPLIRFSEMSLKNPTKVRPGRRMRRLHTARRLLAYTVFNFGIEAIVSGIVPTKAFFCRYLAGQT